VVRGKGKPEDFGLEETMSKKIIGLALCAMLLALGFPAEAQQAGKVYLIGFLGDGAPGILQKIKLKRPQRGSILLNFFAFWQGLDELGYVEGQNLVKEYRLAEGKRERLPDLAAELVRLKVDVIVTTPSPGAIRAAQRATRTIPIVMSGIRVDPVEAGFVASLARPGGNITGLTQRAPKLNSKRLELLKEAFPRISRVAILWPPDHQKHAMKEVEAAGQTLGIQIQSLVITLRRSGSFESALSAISQERPDGLLVGPSVSMNRHRERIREFTAKRGLPTIYAQSRFVNAGGLMSYGPSIPDIFRRAAIYVDKILKGAKPADLPVERPMKFELVINLKTAKQLGFTIPRKFLARADKVIR
jgi:putative ABC transport system substrate-binding protein